MIASKSRRWIVAQDVQIAFAMFDTDFSGCIDKDEFQALFDTLKASNPGDSGPCGRTGFVSAPSPASEHLLPLHAHRQLPCHDQQDSAESDDSVQLPLRGKFEGLSCGMTWVKRANCHSEGLDYVTLSQRRMSRSLAAEPLSSCVKLTVLCFWWGIRRCLLRREDSTGLYTHFFGPDMRKQLSVVDFGKFLEQMNTELDRLEFQHYDTKNTVRLLVSYGGINQK